MSNVADQIIIGADGGGSGCRVAIARLGGACLAQADGGPANVSRDRGGALDNLRACLAQAQTLAGLSDAVMGSATLHAGLAGVLSVQDAGMVQNALPFDRCTVTDDRPTALAGALGGAEGFLAAVGTGSLIATNKGGPLRSVGGWGFEIGDQASGAWLGRRLLEETLLAHDTIVQGSDLTGRVMARFGGTPSGLVSFGLRATPRELACFAPEIAAAHAQGDVVARALLDEGARYLRRALRALGHRTGDQLCLSGGLGATYAARLGTDMAVTRARGSALDGALLLAAQAAQQAADPQVAP